MSNTDQTDDTWEEFFGSSPDLMPSIMGAIDALLENVTNEDAENRTSTPKKSYQANNFANLSPNVQKILSNVPDQELTKHFSSEEVLSPRRSKCFQYASTRSLRSPEKTIQRNNENVISHSIQKMLSNLPDSELVISPTGLNCGDKKVGRNSSFLHTALRSESVHQGLKGDTSDIKCNNGTAGRVGVTYDDNKSCGPVDLLSDCEKSNCDSLECSDSFSCKPLGSYLHTSPSGITSRTPVGRLNMGKMLQVASESSVATNSTASSEVSRPVSLTSLGSCSSSGSSGPHQGGSAYLASAESLDSDPEPNGSQGSADSGIADQPTMSPEMRVLQEVMDTETDYVADLKEVIEGYLDPWREEKDCPLQSFLPDLFSNLEEIYKFNRSFLEQLMVGSCDPSHVATVFLHNDSGFSVYSEYCTNYPRTMDILVKLTRDDKMAPLFKEQQLKLKHALPLGSYLLKPVQRILKYHLLLQRLSKQCELKHKPSVDLALTTMTGIASHINTMKRKHEHAVRVQEIQSQLYGWTGADLTALGELIAEGTFRVGGARGRRHVFLFDKVLLMAKSKQDGALAYKNHIMCSNLMLVEQVRGEPLSFHILPFDNPRLQCTLRARSPQHKREWTLQIKRVILENYSAVIPNHARQLVMQLGQDIANIDESTEKWTPLKQHSTPQYLERRSRVRKSNNFSNRRAASQDRLFVSLGSWRRKSEPDMIPQYNTKTMPKKIYKIKKAKDRSAKFYTDLSDSENCDVIGESCDNLTTNCTKNGLETPDNVKDCSLETSEQCSIEQVVSDLLMQNEEFKNFSGRKKKQRGSEPLPEVWSKSENELPSKADSLPRNIQLNDQIDSQGKQTNSGSVQESSSFDVKDRLSPRSYEENEHDVSSELDDGEHPEHKIYRKSTIRFSLLQRFRTIISEEQKRSGKSPTYKQGSRRMGEKIANPDYVDPYTLFNSRSPSQANLVGTEATDIDLMGEPERLDLSINENDVLTEFENRLKSEPDRSCSELISDTGQIDSEQKSSQRNKSNKAGFDNSVCSSQNSDSFYETIMERSLNEEIAETNNLSANENECDFQSVRTKLVENNSDYIINRASSNLNSEIVGNIINSNAKVCKNRLKRPTKAPPPIPHKPIGLSSINNTNANNYSQINRRSHSIETTCSKAAYNNSIKINGESKCETISNSKSWVKTMVHRFE